MDKLKEFKRESNFIEHERETDSDGREIGRLNPGDMKAVQMAIDINIKNKFSPEWILGLHAIVGEYLNKPWVGKWRDCQVYIKKNGITVYTPPAHKYIPKLMETFCRQLPLMDPWTAYLEFETIHPFQDLNGRVGRLIWLAKMRSMGCNGSLSFLELAHYHLFDLYREK